MADQCETHASSARAHARYAVKKGARERGRFAKDHASVTADTAINAACCAMELRESHALAVFWFGSKVLFISLGLMVFAPISRVVSDFLEFGLFEEASEAVATRAYLVEVFILDCLISMSNKTTVRLLEQKKAPVLPAP